MVNKKLQLFFFRAIAVSAPLLLVFACFEVALRFTGPHYYQFNKYSQVYYTNPRGYYNIVGMHDSGFLYGLAYKQSEEGFRLPLSQAAAGEKTGRRIPSILILGDSFTYGRGVRYKDLYATRLQKKLDADGEGERILNCATENSDLQEIIETYETQASRHKFKVVVYGFVLNDFGLVSGGREIVGSDFIDQNNGGNSWNRFRAMSAVVNYVFHTLDRIRLSHRTARAYLDAFRGENAKTHFKKLNDLNEKVKADGGRLVIVVFPLLYNFSDYPFKEIHKKIRSFCAERDIAMLDLFAPFSRHRSRQLWAAPTDHHPNEIAHQIAAKELADFLYAGGLLERPDQKGHADS